ncbi:MAG TPA: type II CAAX endopeptidase family protein, partial [Humisphaera sp.]|nr:type II CAAX endopeptidase family protein [Humisphaera sp.]
MTHLPYASQSGSPPLPPASVPPPPMEPPANSGVRRLVAWAVILWCSGFVAVRVYQSYHRQPLDITDPSKTHSVQLEIAARYIIGAKEITKKLSPNTATTSLQDSIAELDKSAKTSVDKLRLTMLIAEISGSKPALDRLDDLSDHVKDPALLDDIEILRTMYENPGATIPEAQRQRLIDRHGWFGSLAAMWDMRGPTPQRLALISQSQRTVYSIFGFFAVICLAALAGFILLIIAIIWYFDGKIARAYSPLPGAPVPFLEAFAIWLGFYLLISFIARKLSPNVLDHAWVYLLAMLLPPAAGLVWPRLCGIDRGYWRAGLGWHAGRGVFREIGCGLLGYVTGLPIMILGFCIMIALTHLAKANPTHPITEEMAGGMRQVFAGFVLACIYAPIVEESLFRGTLFHYLRGRHGWLVSACISSFLFAAIHPQGWTVVPVLFSIAFVFAAIREWRGSILCSAAA